jgi:hypothetical protein
MAASLHRQLFPEQLNPLILSVGVAQQKTRLPKQVGDMASSLVVVFFFAKEMIFPSFSRACSGTPCPINFSHASINSFLSMLMIPYWTL